MLSLELWTKNSQGERTYQGTYRRTWKTMRGLENFRQKVMDYNGYALEDFKIKGEESRKDNTKAVGTLKVGDVLHSVYGYDMILNSYYEVVKVSPSGKTVQIRPLRKNYDGSPNDIAGCTVYPDLTSPTRFAGKATSHIFSEYHKDKNEVVYWLDLDNDSYYVTQSVGSTRLDSMVRSVALAGR